MIAYFYDFLNTNSNFRHVAQFSASGFVDISKIKNFVQNIGYNVPKIKKQNTGFLVSSLYIN